MRHENSNHLFFCFILFVVHTMYKCPICKSKVEKLIPYLNSFFKLTALFDSKNTLLKWGGSQGNQKLPVHKEKHGRKLYVRRKPNCSESAGKEKPTSGTV